MWAADGVADADRASPQARAVWKLVRYAPEKGVGSAQGRIRPLLLERPRAGPQGGQDLPSLTSTGRFVQATETPFTV